MKPQELKDRLSGSERSLGDKLRIFGGLTLLALFGVIILFSVAPLIGFLLLAALVLIPIFRLTRRSSLGVGGRGQRIQAVLLKFLAVAGAVSVLVLIFLNSPVYGIVGVIAFGVAFGWFVRQREHQAHERRMLPNHRQAIEVTLSPMESDSETLFRDIFHRISSNAAGEGETLSSADRRETRGVVSAVLIADRPDQHGQVRLRSFLEGHEDTDPAEELETLVQQSFAGDATISPVDPNSYIPFAAADQWRASQGSDPDSVVETDLPD